VLWLKINNYHQNGFMLIHFDKLNFYIKYKIIVNLFNKEWLGGVGGQSLLRKFSGPSPWQIPQYATDQHTIVKKILTTETRTESSKLPSRTFHRCTRTSLHSPSQPRRVFLFAFTGSQCSWPNIIPTVYVRKRVLRFGSFIASRYYKFVCAIEFYIYTQTSGKKG